MLSRPGRDAVAARGSPMRPCREGYRRGDDLSPPAGRLEGRTRGLLRRGEPAVGAATCVGARGDASSRPFGDDGASARGDGAAETAPARGDARTRGADEAARRRPLPAEDERRGETADEPARENVAAFEL